MFIQFESSGIQKNVVDDITELTNTWPTTVVSTVCARCMAQQTQEQIWSSEYSACKERGSTETRANMKLWPIKSQQNLTDYRWPKNGFPCSWPSKISASVEKHKPSLQQEHGKTLGIWGCWSLQASVVKDSDFLIRSIKVIVTATKSQVWVAWPYWNRGTGSQKIISLHSNKIARCTLEQPNKRKQKLSNSVLTFANGEDHGGNLEA